VNIKALAFDTGGTVLDWHAGLVKALDRVGARHGVTADWHALANDRRRGTMKGIVGQVRPDFHMDDVHRRVLDDTLAQFGLDSFTMLPVSLVVDVSRRNGIVWDAIISCE
jgi:2-haloacid dehalogenase